MSLKTVYQNILKLKETASTNSKTLLLTEMLKNDDFKRVTELTYSDEKHFNIQTLPKRKVSSTYTLWDTSNKKTGNQEIFNFLEKLSEQRGTSQEDKENLVKLSSCDEETYNVVKMIVNKDFKCGIGQKTINKAMPGLIYIMPYCRCSTEKKIDNINFENGAFAQEKADGMFVNVIISPEKTITFKTRNGNKVHQLQKLNSILHKKVTSGINTDYANTVYMGELLVRVNGKILDRQTGNGILNSCIQNTANQAMADCVIVKLWDAVPFHHWNEHKSSLNYSDRWNRVNKFVDYLYHDEVTTISTNKVNSLREAKDFYKKMRKEGKEGAIIKNRSMKWKFHDSPDAVKLKNVSDAELRIVGWKYGKEGTKIENVMGTLQVATDDGLVQVNISGFTDKQRELNWDEMIGKIVTVEFESLIQDKSRPGIYSLYLPRFADDELQIRMDRSQTDTLEDIQNRTKV